MIAGVVAEELLLPLAIPPSATYVDPDIFQQAIIKVPGFLLFEGQFDEGDLIYAAYVGDVDNSIYPPLLVDTDGVYNFGKGFSAAIVAPSFVDVDIVYSPTVNGKVLGPQLFVDVDVFGGARKITQGKATINQTVPIGNVVDVDLIYGPIVERAGVAIITQQAALATDTDVVYLDETTAATSSLFGMLVSETASFTPPPLAYLTTHALGPDDVISAPDVSGSLSTTLLVDPDTFWPPASLNHVLPGIVVDGDAVFAPASGWQLQPGIVIDLDRISGPFFAQPGSFDLVIDAAEFLSPPTVTVQGAPINASLVNASDTLYAPAVNPAVVATYVVDPDIIPSPIIKFGALTPVVSVVDPEPIFIPVIGDAPHVPSLVVDPDAFLAPSVGITQMLGPGIVADGDAFYVPSIAGASGFYGTLALDGPIMPATPQPTVIYIEG
jgi:hypothetical protein